ncbi:VP1 protein [Striga asiatica]|uniref:VP1 protein n=1 Tax=Striga asiatica TaxID=4170 RepID=A0A5A7QSW9_STRAF|nr:VP1 protein [Striga asiatica]
MKALASPFRRIERSGDDEAIDAKFGTLSPSGAAALLQAIVWAAVAGAGWGRGRLSLPLLNSALKVDTNIPRASSNPSFHQSRTTILKGLEVTTKGYTKPSNLDR